MMNKVIPLIFGMVVGTSSAVTYSTVPLANDGSNLFNSGTQITGQDFGGGDSNVTVNGVSFELNVAGVAHTAGGGIGGRNAVNTTFFTGGNADLQAVANDIVFGASASVTFSGLVNGTTYVAQFISWDADVDGEGNPGIDKELRNTLITSDIDGDSHTQQQVVFSGAENIGGQNFIEPVITTATFVANGATAQFDFGLDPGRTFDDNIILNGATIHAIPEPSSALLSSLAALALLRRRRG